MDGASLVLGGGVRPLLRPPQPGGGCKVISFNSLERHYTYSSTPPLFGKTVSLNAGRATSSLGVEYNFAVLAGMVEGFGTKTGGGSYLEWDPTAFSEELLSATFSVESCKGDPSLKEAGRFICKAGGVTSL